MPNYVQIRFTVEGSPEDLAAFSAGVATDERRFDFERLIPMPKSLRVESGSSSSTGYAAASRDPQEVARYLSMPWVRQLGITSADQFVEYVRTQLPDTYALGLVCVQNVAEHGHPTWYEWSLEHWGVKWNAGSLEVTEHGDKLEYYFEAANSFPEPVFEALASRFPTVKLNGTVDEEGGWFYGEITIEHGELVVDFRKGTRKGGPYDYSDEDDDGED